MHFYTFTHLPLSCIRKLRSVLDLPYALSSSVDEKSSSFTFFTKKDLGMFRAQRTNPRPARYPFFIHRRIEGFDSPVLQLGWNSNTWAKKKTRNLRLAMRPFCYARALPHRRNATSALDSSRQRQILPPWVSRVKRVRTDPMPSRQWKHSKNQHL